MTTSSTNNDHPYYGEISKIKSSEVPSFFRENGGKRMKFVSLGELLDFSSAGGMNFCYWNMDSRGLSEFVGDWMAVQEPRIDIGRNPHPTSGGVYALGEIKREEVFEWNRQRVSFLEELPYVDSCVCLKDSSHIGTIKDLGGKLRCAHIGRKKMRPSFIKQFVTNSGEVKFYEEEPLDPSYDGGTDITHFPQPDYAEYLDAKRLWASEKLSAEVTSPCYSIIQDVGAYLPLEKVFQRLSVGTLSKGIAFPFDGFGLANYVAAWANQFGERKFFTSLKEQDPYKKFPNF